MKIENFLGEYNAFGYKEEDFYALLNSIKKSRKLEGVRFMNIGKGRWLISSVFISKEIKIISSFLPRLLIVNLIDKVITSGRIDYIFKGDVVFWDSTSTDKKKELVKFLKDETIALKVYKEDEEMSSLEFSISGIASKEKIISLLESFFSLWFFDANLKLSLQENSFMINFLLENKELTIECNNLEKIRNFLESYFMCQDFDKGSFCFYYADIKTIEGKGWKKAIRHGELVKQYGTLKNPKVEKHKF